MDEEEQIRAYYYTLFQVWGPQHWWPARSRFEVIVGAYLTQHTSWTNVGQHPIFVVDAYTRRLLARHDILPENARYEVIRKLCERALARVAAPDSLPPLKIGKQQVLFSHRPSPMSLAKRSPVAQAYNDMHGLIVQIGKHYCLKSRPRCEQCPLQRFLPA